MRLIRISMRFALLLKDDFSGATVAGAGQRFLVDGRPVTPVRKPDGFYVFLAEPNERPKPKTVWRVTVESAHYETRTVRIRADTLEENGALYTVQLYRKPHSGFSDCRWMEAEAVPGILAVALIDGGDAPLSLRGLSEDGRSLRLAGYSAANLLWRRVYVGKGRKAELFTLTGRTAEGAYTLDRAARWPHEPGEPVLLAACAPADASGLCRIPLRPEWENAEKTILAYDEEAMRWRATSCARARR